MVEKSFAARPALSRAEYFVLCTNLMTDFFSEHDVCLTYEAPLASVIEGPSKGVKYIF